MNAQAPLIPGSENLQSLTVQLFDTNSINCNDITTKKFGVNVNVTVPNNFIANSGTGSIIKGNDTAGQISFNVNTSGSEQFKLFYNTSYETEPFVIISQITPYIVSLTQNNDIYGPVPFVASSTTEFFTISIQNTVDMILTSQNVLFNYLVIGS